MNAKTTLCFLLLCGGAVRADERPADRTGREADGGRVRKVTAIIGAGVTVEKGDLKLGKVVDLVLSEGGCVDFLIVDSEEGLVAVPWGGVTYNAERRGVVITQEITREKLKDVTFSKDRWPDFYTTGFSQKLRGAWGDRGLRHGGRTGGDDRRPDGDKDRRDPGDRDRKDRDREPVKDREPQKDRVAPPKDREPARDKVEPPRDREPQRDRVEPPKDRPRDKPKDRPRDA